MAEFEGLKADNKHALVRALVRQIPSGQVASYGMVASLCAGVTPRLVGFVMAGLEAGTDVPWQRVVNASGGISPRPGSDLQREKLESEGIVFTNRGKINWQLYAWEGPSDAWLQENGLEPEIAFFLKAGWPQKSTP